MVLLEPRRSFDVEHPLERFVLEFLGYSCNDYGGLAKKPSMRLLRLIINQRERKLRQSDEIACVTKGEWCLLDNTSAHKLHRGMNSVRNIPYDVLVHLLY